MTDNNATNTTLLNLKIGDTALVKSVQGSGSNRQHILDMGILPGVAVKLVKYAPMGDPLEIKVHGYLLAIRKSDAELINIEPISTDTQESWTTGALDKEDQNRPYIESLHDHNAHPGIGEDDDINRSMECKREHHEHALPSGTTITFALAGQQNCGKTTLFNQLTGTNQHVGNFPGVTVDRKDGVIKGYPETLVTDLPGLYSLSPYTTEEQVSRRHILEEKPRGIINIADAGNIERSLYLTMQLMELDIPMVLALNMMDEMRNNGGTVRINEMERILGIPVIPISAARNEGIDELIDHAIHVSRYQEPPLRQDFCDKDAFGGSVHRCLHSIMHLIEDHSAKSGIPLRFAASKVVEGDMEIIRQLQLTENELETIEHIITQMEEERGLDRSAAIADMRYSFIRHVCQQTVVKPHESKEYIRSQKMDHLLTGRWTALPIFITTMALVIWLSVDLIGSPLQQLLERLISSLGQLCAGALVSWNVAPVVQSLVVDALFGGVGSLVSFVPIIIVLFFFLSILEDSGYMARVAFVTDKLLRKIGLAGRSIVPLLIGFGCSVPAYMSSRTLSSARDRRMTVILTPFVSCSAKIPVYVFLAGMFFPNHTGLVLVGLYLLGILLGVVTAIVAKHMGRKSEAAPFVMELPNYRMPGAKNVAHLLWDKTMDFLQRAFTVIFLATLVIWFLQTFNFQFQMVANGEGSILAYIANLIAPVFHPMGLDNWQIVTSLISGFLAKESVVASLQVLNATALLTPLTVIPLLVFCLLYTPCSAAIATINREQGWKMALFVVVFQCLLAWVCAFVSYEIASLFISLS